MKKVETKKKCEIENRFSLESKRRSEVHDRRKTVLEKISDEVDYEKPLKVLKWVYKWFKTTLLQQPTESS